MSQSTAFVARLTDNRLFGPGERARLRVLAGQGLNEDVWAFDLFTRLWWPLRKKGKAPRREVAWLMVKLYAACPIPHVRPDTGEGPALAEVLGRGEPARPACPDAALLTGPLPEAEPARSQFILARRYRRRFDALLDTSLSGLEPQLRWALSEVRKAVGAGQEQGIDWVRLTDDLSTWDRGEGHRLDRDVRDIWAEQYL